MRSSVILLLLLCLLLPAARARAQEAMPPDAVTVTSRLGQGLEVRTRDDDFRLNIRGRLQLRGSLLSEEAGAPPEVADLQARRIRLVFQGHVLGGQLQHYLQLSFSNLDTEPDLRLPLRDAYLTWTRLRDFQLRFGQMKVPFGRQRVVSSSALQMADRSIAVGELNLDRDVGLQLFSTNLLGLGERFGYNLGLFSGNGRNRIATAPGILLVARLSFQPFGAFDDFMEADLQRLARPRLALAIAGARNWNTNRPRSTIGLPFSVARFDYEHLTGDLMFKWRGLSVISEIILRRADRPFQEGLRNGLPVREFSRSAWGGFIQAGYLFTEHLELTARYSELRPLGEGDPTLRRTRELGGGAGWYFSGHNLKLQGDYLHLSEAGAEGRHQLRLQMQLFY